MSGQRSVWVFRFICAIFYLGMASKMSMNVSMMLPIKWNEAVCTDKNCQKIQILTCINFQGPASIFPSKR